MLRRLAPSLQCALSARRHQPCSALLSLLFTNRKFCSQPSTPTLYTTTNDNDSSNTTTASSLSSDFLNNTDFDSSTPAIDAADMVSASTITREDASLEESSIDSTNSLSSDSSSSSAGDGDAAQAANSAAKKPHPNATPKKFWHAVQLSDNKQTAPSTTHDILRFLQSLDLSRLKLERPLTLTDIKVGYGVGLELVQYVLFFDTLEQAAEFSDVVKAAGNLSYYPVVLAQKLVASFHQRYTVGEYSGRCLKVSNLPPHTGVDVLYDLFSKFAIAEEGIYVVPYTHRKRGPGVAAIRFANEADAFAALRAKHGSFLSGFRICAEMMY